MEISFDRHFRYKDILRTVTPAILMMIVTSVYSIIDGYFVSNYVGTTAFAAINLVSPIAMIIAAIGFMVGTGGSALIAKTLGRKKEENANQIFSMLLQFLLSIGIPLSILLFFFAKEICQLLGAEGDLLVDSIVYTRFLSISLPAFMLQIVFQSFYMVAGRPLLGTIMSVVCGVANVLLDLLFVVHLQMGIEGAGIATNVAEFIGGFFPIYYFSTSRKDLRLKLIHTKWVWRYIVKTCLNGSSEYVGNIAFSIVSICYNIQLIRFLGEAGIAAYGIILYVGYIFYAIIEGYNIAITPIVGYQYGAGNKRELHNLFKKSIVIMTVGGFGLMLLSELSSHPLAVLFVGYDASLTELATHAFRIYMLSFVICGVNLFISALFTGLNNGGVSAFIAIIRSLVFETGAVFILPFFLGSDGIWCAVIVAEVLAAGVSFYLIRKHRNRYGY